MHECALLVGKDLDDLPGLMEQVLPDPDPSVALDLCVSCGWARVWEQCRNAQLI